MSDSRLPVWWRLAVTYQRTIELVSQQTWLKDSIQQPGQGKGAGSCSCSRQPPKQEWWSCSRTEPDMQASIAPIPPLLLPQGPGFGWCLQTHTHLWAPKIQVFGLEDKDHWTPGDSNVQPSCCSYSANHIFASTSQKSFKRLQTFTF